MLEMIFKLDLFLCSTIYHLDRGLICIMNNNLLLLWTIKQIPFVLQNKHM